LVEGGEVSINGEEGGRQVGVGGGTEIQEEFDEALSVKGFGDAHSAQGVAPLGGEQRGGGFVEEFKGGGAVDGEAEFVVGVGDGEGGTGFQAGVEFCKVVSK